MSNRPGRRLLWIVIVLLVLGGVGYFLLGTLSAATLLWVILYDVFLRRKIRHLWRKLRHRGHHHHQQH